jgi:hypothetical protein
VETVRKALREETDTVDLEVVRVERPKQSDVTVTENVRMLAEEVKRSLSELIHEHSTLYLAYPPGSNLISTSRNAWSDLDPAGKRIQTKLLSQYRRLHALLRTLLQGLSKDDLSAFKDNHTIVLKVIEQGRTWSESKEEELEKARGAIDKTVGFLEHLFGASEAEVILVPDTNALLHNTAIESWEFKEFSQFCIMLTPTVMSELDRLKIIHKNQSVRGKAEKLIRQIKEYRRRGNWFEGVVLRNGVSILRAIATEPSLSESLPWLKGENADDRLLASVLEIMCAHPRSNIHLVSRDLNVQNKAEYAGIPYLEPPDPPKPLRKGAPPAGGTNV